MGVEFFPCESCREIYCDAGEYFSCDCGNGYCSDECGDRQSDDEDGKLSCKICRGEVVTPEQLEKYLIKLSGKTRSEHIAVILKERKQKKPNAH